jgi:hypothetical protein
MLKIAKAARAFLKRWRSRLVSRLEEEKGRRGDLGRGACRTNARGEVTQCNRDGVFYCDWGR